jgi:maleylacetate reductase
MSLGFTYDALPGRVVFGSGAAARGLTGEIDHLGGRRVLLVVTEEERPLGEVLSAPLGDRLVQTFTGVRPHVPAEVAARAREVARDSEADVVLSIGGGSTTGTAKAIALETGLPIVAVPTTYAGSEMTPVWGLTDGGHKRTGRSASVQPKSVIYDPELTVTLPRSVTGPSAMNALAHCVEALYVPASNPVVSLIAEEGARAIATGAPAAVQRPADLEGRSQTLYGAYLAGAAFAAVGGGLHHKICHVLGGAYDLPHAETHTIVLPHVAALFAAAAAGAMDRVARAIGAPAAPSGLFDLAEALGAPTALSAIGFRERDLDAAVALVLDEVPSDNPCPVGRREIRAVLEGAVTGRRPIP